VHCSDKKVVDNIIASVDTDSEADTESVDFSAVRPSTKPRFFCGRKWRFWDVCPLFAFQWA